jgi:hypothetical protein
MVRLKENGELGPDYTVSHPRNVSRVACGLSNFTGVTSMHHAMQAAGDVEVTFPAVTPGTT